jgi:hypothetical protein
MLWGSDLDGVAMLAKERHADMLADAMRRQQLQQMVAGREHKHSLWQWLRQATLGRLPQQGSREPASMPRTLLHS